MNPYRMFKTENLQQSIGHQSCVLLDRETGCEGECMAGISLYQTETFSEPQKHAFQEGFYVLKGEGFALVGEQEFVVSPRMAFLVPIDRAHSIRKGPGYSHVKVFWFRSV